MQSSIGYLKQKAPAGNGSGFFFAWFWLMCRALIFGRDTTNDLLRKIDDKTDKIIEIIK
jgi:hypothetical protein